MNKRLATLKILFILILAFGVAILIKSPEETPLTGVYMLDVGQGDSFLIQTGTSQMLIDGGRDIGVISELSNTLVRGDRSIDIVLATHPDEDHIGGLVHVLSKYQVGMFLTSDAFSDTETFREINTILTEKNIQAVYVRRGMTFDLGVDTKFEVLFPDRDTDNWKTNTASVIGRLDMEGKSYLFTGDAPTSIEDFLIKTQKEKIDVDILKLGHHGSETSTRLAFLKATSPELALISSGKGNSYGHPHVDVLNRLKELSIPFKNTAEEGTVFID